jgi:multidrug efflux pump subunit AcrB
VVDTDWYVEAPHAKVTLAVDGEKAAAAGLSSAAVAAVVRMAGAGKSAGLLHDERAREDVPIVIRLPRGGRNLEAVRSIRLRGTSMIGFIAGAGIVVRNSIILVDFIELRLLAGVPLAQAVVDAGAVRFRPMGLTAAAMIVGAVVILFDPILQGLGISLMAGEVASLLRSRMAVPVLYYMAKRHEHLDPVPAAASIEAGCRSSIAEVVIQT